MAVVRIQALSLLKARVQSLVGETKNLKPGHPPPKKKSQKRVKDKIKGNTRGKGRGCEKSKR